jgi:hypothetical protein
MIVDNKMFLARSNYYETLNLSISPRAALPVVVRLYHNANSVSSTGKSQRKYLCIFEGKYAKA